MADLPPNPHSDGGAGDVPESTPRWVYVSAIIVVVLVVLFVIVHLTGGGLGGHTP